MPPVADNCNCVLPKVRERWRDSSLGDAIMGTEGMSTRHVQAGLLARTVAAPHALDLTSWDELQRIIPNAAPAEVPHQPQTGKKPGQRLPN